MTLAHGYPLLCVSPVRSITAGTVTCRDELCVILRVLCYRSFPGLFAAPCDAPALVLTRGYMLRANDRRYFF
ncbi:hypothetical protein HRUBRA_00524 [Pseudohaliea rubra DSM 19751]|uniref:Uncharacterized protein n=1 Tax=Pseudohaliea rubra DSM 19751 TaxID=1265313 RepID=A0A095VTQ7_9GAMM|nr:hypothetical protein HRUBRA_00524 [Pseudohaliea rubra DSM 19751]